MAPTIPSLTSAFASLQNVLRGPLTLPTTGARPGVSAPSALGMASVASAPAVPSLTPAPNATSVATKQPVYASPSGTQAPARPAVPSFDFSRYAPQSPTSPYGIGQPPAPNATSATTGKPVYMPPPGQDAPNATSVATGKPTYMPPPAAPTKPAVPQTASMAPATGTAAPTTAPTTVAAPTALPQAPTAPLAISEAPSVGSNTGNASSATSYSSSAGAGSSGGSPALPSLADRAFEEYLKSLQPSDEEQAYQKRLDEINLSADKAYVDTQNQPIALPFITGQQAALQRSAALQTKPLEATLARMQAKRTAAGEGTKAAFERLDTKEKDLRSLSKPVEVSFGGSLVDPTTGQPVGGGGAFNSAKSATDSWVNLIKGGQAQLSDVPQQLRQSVAEGLSGSTQVSKASQDAIAQADTVIQKVDEIIPTIDFSNTGAAAYLAGVKGTPQYNLATQLDTIKANVGCAALQAMRAASPTGGALGQVSEQENRLLQSTLASLDQGQSSEQLKANLAKVKLHFENLKKILNAPIGAQVSYDDKGNVSVLGGSASSSKGGDAASEGWF